MPLTENEARKRRLMMRDAFRFMNARVIDKKTFTRSEMFGPESVGKGAIPGFTRRVMARLARNQKVVLDNVSSTRPSYKAIQVVKMTDEEISKYLRYNDEDEELEEGEQAPAAPAVEFSEEEPEEIDAATAVTQPAREDAGEPDTRQMLASLISILPDIVKAIHRIETRVVAIETRQKTLFEGAERIEKAVSGESEGTLRGDINSLKGDMGGLLELVYKLEK